ncbi:MAG: hypothetical protein KDA20_08850 [Phycisphaerales bacterium]|nr:hypothetical protein [Phycisphaerales bacterium]
MKRIGSIALAAAGMGVVGGCSSWGGAGYHSINTVTTSKTVDEVHLVQVSDIDALLSSPRIDGSMVVGYQKFTTSDPTAFTPGFADAKFGPVAMKHGANIVRWGVNEIEPSYETAEGMFFPGKYEYAAVFYGPMDQPVATSLSFKNSTDAPSNFARVAFSSHWINEKGQIDAPYAAVETDGN